MSNRRSVDIRKSEDLIRLFNQFFFILDITRSTQIPFAFIDSPMATFNRVGKILFDHVYHDRIVQKNSN